MMLNKFEYEDYKSVFENNNIQIMNGGCNNLTIDTLSEIDQHFKKVSKPELKD